MQPDRWTELSRAAPRAPHSNIGARHDLADALDAGVAELALELDSDDRERLLRYLDLLLRWNRVYNLTAVREPQAMLIQHLFDSLAVVAPLRCAGLPAVLRALDVGSGAGLPGIPLAIAWAQSELELIEPVGKKAAFLRQCVGELGLADRVRVHAKRVQELPAMRPDLIICRAYASLTDFVASARRHAQAQTLLVAMKGVRPDAEIEALSPEWRVQAVPALRVPRLEAERHLVMIRLEPTDPGSP